MNQADVTKLVSALRIAVKPRYRQFATPEGPEGRLRRMRETVTALVKYERIELNYPRADEARGYAERLIADAIRYGDRHRETMDSANYWLNEKQLIHKLFKVLAPRYENYTSSYTRLLKGPNKYPGFYTGQAVLELKGNPFPSILSETHSHKYWLHNVLLEEAKKEFRSQKTAAEAEQTRESKDTEKSN